MFEFRQRGAQTDTIAIVFAPTLGQSCRDVVSNVLPPFVHTITAPFLLQDVAAAVSISFLLFPSQREDVAAAVSVSFLMFPSQRKDAPVAVAVSFLLFPSHREDASMLVMVIGPIFELCGGCGRSKTQLAQARASLFKVHMAHVICHVHLKLYLPIVNGGSRGRATSHRI